jgi:hypothetical protein
LAVILAVIARPTLQFTDRCRSVQE